MASAEGVDGLHRLEEKIRTECPFLGKQVVITGTSREDRNSQTGTATGFDRARGRYVVELEGEGKAQNLGGPCPAHGPKRPGKKETKTETEMGATA